VSGGGGYKTYYPESMYLNRMEGNIDGKGN